MRVRGVAARRILALLLSPLTRFLAEPSELLGADRFGFRVVWETYVRVQYLFGALQVAPADENSDPYTVDRARNRPGEPEVAAAVRERARALLRLYA
jgi:hypothetical protein